MFYQTSKNNYYEIHASLSFGIMTVEMNVDIFFVLSSCFAALFIFDKHEQSSQIWLHWWIV